MLYVIGKQTALLAIIDHLLSTAEIGETEIELHTLSRQPIECRVLLAQIIVGIIRIVLVDDIADETVCRGRLHTETTAIPDAAQPTEISFQFIHTHKVNKLFNSKSAKPTKS